MIFFNSDIIVTPQPLLLSNTGDAGVGNSHLVNTVRLFLEKKITDYVGIA